MYQRLQHWLKNHQDGVAGTVLVLVFFAGSCVEPTPVWIPATAILLGLMLVWITFVKGGITDPAP